MNIKKILIHVVIVVIIATAFLIFRDSRYISTDKYIDGYEIYAFKTPSGPAPAAISEVILFANSEFKYSYTICYSCEEHIVKMYGRYVPLSKYVRQGMMTIERLEESGIGKKVYWRED